jgi:hypothetical protein
MRLARLNCVERLPERSYRVSIVWLFLAPRDRKLKKYGVGVDWIQQGMVPWRTVVKKVLNFCWSQKAADFHILS